MLMKSVEILRLEIPDLNHAIPHTLDYIWLYLSKSGLGLCLRINDRCFCLDESDCFVADLFTDHSYGMWILLSYDVCSLMVLNHMMYFPLIVLIPAGVCGDYFPLVHYH